MFNIYLGCYIIIAIIVIAGGSYKLFNQYGPISGILFFGLSLTLFIIYGISWFAKPDSIFSVVPVPYPPVINTCPDYLTYYERTQSNGVKQKTCIDTIGVSRNGVLKKFDTTNTPPIDDSYYFILNTQSSNPEGIRTELCQRVIANGLTWEGVSDGTICYPLDPADINPGGTIGTIKVCTEFK